MPEHAGHCKSPIPIPRRFAKDLRQVQFLSHSLFQLLTIGVFRLQSGRQFSMRLIKKMPNVLHDRDRVRLLLGMLAQFDQFLKKPIHVG